jgi:hypothetical protein
MTARENSRSRLGGSESRFNGQSSVNKCCIVDPNMIFFKKSRARHIAAKMQTHPVSSGIGMQELTQNLEYTSKGLRVSNVSIIFDAPCLFLHHLPNVCYTSWHFYAFFGTNLLTSRHSASSLFSTIFVFQKSYTGNILGIGQNKPLAAPPMCEGASVHL